MKERFDKLGELWGNLASFQETDLLIALGGIPIGLSMGILSWSGESSSMRVLVNWGGFEDLAEN